MITPQEIKNKEFKKTFRGYDEIEVDEFLDKIISSYEKIYNENTELKDKLMVLNEKLTKYDNLEQTLKDTLIVAQTTSDDVIKSSKEKAELIISTAELESKKILDLKNDKLEELKHVYDNMKKEASVFKTRYKALIESQLATIEDFEVDLSKDFNLDDIPEIDIDEEVNKRISESIDSGEGLSLKELEELLNNESLDINLDEESQKESEEDQFEETKLENDLEDLEVTREINEEELIENLDSESDEEDLDDSNK